MAYMPRKKKNEIRMICVACGKEADQDIEKSTENWKVYKTTCACGGKIVSRLIC